MPQGNKRFQFIFVMTAIDKSNGWAVMHMVRHTRARLRAHLVRFRKCFTMANMSRKCFPAVAATASQVFDLPVFHRMSRPGGAVHVRNAGAGAAGLLQTVVPGYHAFDVRGAAPSFRRAKILRATYHALPGR